MSYTKPGITCLSFGSPVPDEHTNNLQRTFPPGTAGSGQSVQAATSSSRDLLSSNTADLVSTAEGIIFINEGHYDDVNKNDNGALSIGKIQWHADRAQSLLKQIVSKGVSLPQSISNDLAKSPTFWTSRTLSDVEAKLLKISLQTKASHDVQDLQAMADITDYINCGRSLGITDNQALVYFADLDNQGGPGGAKRVVTAAGGGLGLTLDAIFRAALVDPALGQNAKKDGALNLKRRTKTYNECKEIDSAARNSIPSPMLRNPINWQHVG